MKRIILIVISIIIGFTPLPKSEPPAVVSTTVKSITITPPVQPTTRVTLDNETIAWNFFMNNGFTANQTAGIIGNLAQEHRFNTSDVEGGLGIAQWMGSRRDSLMSRDNYLTIEVQLQFLLDELNTYHSYSKSLILASTTVESAAEAFQTHFERCNPRYCMLDKRIEYGYTILVKHS